MEFATLVISICSTHFVVSSKSGAPCSAQLNLQPSPLFHGAAQNIAESPPPYTVTVEDESGKIVHSYAAGKVYTLKITAMAHLRGFLIQPKAATKSRQPIGRLRVGEFVPDDSWAKQGIQFQKCESEQRNSITHQTSDARKQLVVNWKSDSVSGPVQFTLSLVAEQSIFWENWMPEPAFLLPHKSTNPNDGSINTPAVAAQEHGGNLSSASHFAGKTAVVSDSLPTTPATLSESPAAGHKEANGTHVDSTQVEKKSPIASLRETLAKIRQNSFPLRTFDRGAGGRRSGLRDKIKESRKGPCSDHECKHGKCQPTTTGYECRCFEGYIGKFCQFNCPTYLCQNGGSCTIQGINYTCLCPEGFRGNHCEEKISESDLTSDEDELLSTASGSQPVDSASSLTLVNNEQGANKSGGKVSVQNLTFEDQHGFSRSEVSSESVHLLKASSIEKRLENVNSLRMTQSKLVLKGRTRGNINKKVKTPNDGDDDGVPAVIAHPSVIRLADKLLHGAEVNLKNGLRNFKLPNPCEEHDCKNGGECIVDKTQNICYTCKCKGEFDGPFCQWDCPAYLCKNGGTCYIDQSFNYLCHCEKGFNGTHCEIKTTSDPRPVNKSEVIASIKKLFDKEHSVDTLIDHAFSQSSADDKFDTNVLREIEANKVDSVRKTKFVHAANANKSASELVRLLAEADQCSTLFCFNEGKCLFNSTSEKPYCSCTERWTGDLCDKQNFCFNHKCEHNSECINGVSNYTCACKGEFSGQFCSVVCPASLCNNNGKCSYDGNYRCACKPGYAGDKCQHEINECASNPCLNGATCIDQVNGFICKCADGYMGAKCHRPCKDTYRRHCSSWKRDQKCSLPGKNSSDFYSLNCARTCGVCVGLREHNASRYVIPPYLEPLDFMIGKWVTNSTEAASFPTGFNPSSVSGYYEEVNVIPGDLMLFGSPALNYSSVAVAKSRDGTSVSLSRAGLFSLKYNESRPEVHIVSLGDDGAWVVEQGTLNGREIMLKSLNITYGSTVRDRKLPVKTKRSLGISGDYLRESLERTYNDSTTEYSTKYYTRSVSYDIY